MKTFRKFVVACGSISIISTFLLMIIVALFYASAVTDPTQIPTYNWPMISWIIGIGGIIQLIAGIGVWMIAIDKNIWIGIEELNAKRNKLIEQEREVLNIRDQLVKAILKTTGERPIKKKID